MHRQPQLGYPGTPTTLNPHDCRPHDGPTQVLNHLKDTIEKRIKEQINALKQKLNDPNLTLKINNQLVETDGHVAKGFSAIMGTGNSVSPADRDQRVSALIEAQKAELLSGEKTVARLNYETLFNNYQVPQATRADEPGLSIDATRAQAQEYLSARLSQEVEKHIRTEAEKIIKAETVEARNLCKQRTSYFSKLIDNGTFNLNDWIENSGLLNPSSQDEKLRFDEELVKLRKVGVWKDPQNTETQPRGLLNFGSKHFAVCRAGMWASWGVAMGTIGFFAATAPIGLVFWVPVGLGINYGIQKGLQFLHDRKFNAMFKEITRELKDAGPMEAGVAWAGVLHKFLTDHKPYWFHNDRTDFLNNHPSMSIDAALRQLRQAAAYGAESIERRHGSDQKQNFFKDTKFNDYINQNNDAMAAIEKRWKFFTKASVATAGEPFARLKKLLWG